MDECFAGIDECLSGVSDCLAGILTGGGQLSDGVVSLSPYFTLKDAAKFKKIWKADYEQFAHKGDCTHYAFSFTEGGQNADDCFGLCTESNKAHCREAYPSAKKVLQHLADVDTPLKAVLDGPADLERLEAHGPIAEIDKLIGPLSSFKCAFYVAEWGFRTSKPAMTDDTVCALYSYFSMKDPNAFKKIWSNAYIQTKVNAVAEKSFQYAFSFDAATNTASCRESYGDADGILLHLKNVHKPFKAAMNGPADLLRVEVHAPKAEINKLKKALGPLDSRWKFFVTEWGFRNAV